MKFLISAASVLALASFASASPLSRRAAAAGKSTRRTNFNRNVTSHDDSRYADEQSTNWGGAIITTTGVTEITGTFTVPTPSVPPGGDSGTQYCGAAWVGIDGDTCQSGLIQTGVFWCVQDGQYSYEAWYEYIPAASIAYSSVTVNAGDQITVTVTKGDDYSGTTSLQNLSSGESDSHTFTEDTDGTLCGYDAEWIVEDFEENGGLVPFADFGTVTFTGSSAVAGGNTIYPNTVIDLVQNGNQLTSTSISGDTVTVNYD